MTNVYYFSGSGHSLTIAEEFSRFLNCEIFEITTVTKEFISSEVAVIVFPVYCQNIPRAVKAFLKRVTAKSIVLIASYGRISYGNVLYEAKKLVDGEIIAAAYIPTGHTFLNGDCDFPMDILQPIAKRIASPQKAIIPRSRKNPLSNIYPALRSRIGVRILKNDNCDKCGICEKNCPAKAIHNGKTNSKCIRCLRCVANCPRRALEFKNTWVLKKYLESYHKEECFLYL